MLNNFVHNFLLYATDYLCVKGSALSVTEICYTYWCLVHILIIILKFIDVVQGAPYKRSSSEGKNLKQALQTFVLA